MEVGKVNKLVVYVAAFCFVGALGVGFVVGEIEGNLWLPRVEAYGEKIVISKKIRN